MASPTMHGEEKKFVQEAFDTNWIAPLGPNVNGFEREMEAYTGIAHCSALSAGTAALHLAVKLLEVGEGDTVICPSLTFAASSLLVVIRMAEASSSCSACERRSAATYLGLAVSSARTRISLGPAMESMLT